MNTLLAMVLFANAQGGQDTNFVGEGWDVLWKQIDLNTAFPKTQFELYNPKPEIDATNPRFRVIVTCPTPVSHSEGGSGMYKGCKFGPGVTVDDVANAFAELSKRQITK